MIAVLRRPQLVLLLLLGLLAGLVGLVGTDRALRDDPVHRTAAVTISEAPPLTWGFKTSWLNYVGEPSMSGGTSTIPTPGQSIPFALQWAFDSGSYDEETGATTLQYRGTAHWEKYHAGTPTGQATKPAGYTGPEDFYVLDVKITDPQVTISRDASHITAHVVSRSLVTWELTDYGRIPVVSLNPVPVTPVVADGVTTWTEVQANATEQGGPAFANHYQPGQAVDPVSFSYTGPGGAPDFSEHFDPPGAPRFTVAQNVNYRAENVVEGVDENGNPFEYLASYTNMTFWIDHAAGIVHVRVRPFSCPGCPAGGIQPFSLTDMQPLADPVALPDHLMNSNPNPIVMDTTAGRYYHRQSDQLWRLSYDRETRQYHNELVTGQLADPAFLGGTLTGTAVRQVWDETRNRGWRVGQVDGVWQLITYTENSDGTWTRRDRPLPTVTPAWTTSYTPFNPQRATLSDGSLIINSGSGSDVVMNRVVLDANDQVAEVQPLALGPLPTGAHVQAYPGGHFTVTPPFDTGVFWQCRIGADNQVTCHQGQIPTPTGEQSRVETWTVDPSDGTLYHSSGDQQRIYAFRDGQFLGSQDISLLNPRGGPMIVGDNHTLYVQSATTPPVFGSMNTWGYAELERVGFVPTVTGQPESATRLLDPGVTSVPVSFTSDATGDPEPSRQWQIKPPTSLVFIDLDGQTAPTLTVDATADLSGALYRAIYTNAAGRVATEPATLTVNAAPGIVLQPQPITVSAGEDAQFQVMPNGSPYPQITWQRLVDGNWVDLSLTDPGYEIEGGFLTIPGATEELTGAVFRAKLSNVVGTIYTDEATLTVSSSPTEPGDGRQLITVLVPELGPGEFLWAIDGTNRTVQLSEAVNAGDRWTATGELIPLSVADTRTGGPEWSISGQVDDFTGSVGGHYLGWSPTVLTPGAGAVAGSTVASGFAGGNGLSGPAGLASASAGHERGTATVGAGLDLQVPINTPPGDYTATLTITALS